MVQAASTNTTIHEELKTIRTIFSKGAEAKKDRGEERQGQENGHLCKSSQQHLALLTLLNSTSFVSPWKPCEPRGSPGGP